MRLIPAIAAALILLAAFEPHSARAGDLGTVKPVLSCAALKQADIEAAVGSATRIESAATMQSGGKAEYCRVRGVISPAVRFEVQLPVARWTQRFVQTGCGGLCGQLDIHLDKAETCKPAQNGELVLASTDMGHQGGMDGTWGRTNYQARVDFAYRGVHVTTLAAKALIERYYGQKARFAYFFGCSDGGREALMEAQRYPQDFNGIIAGAPAMNFTTQNSFFHGWNAVQNQHSDGSPILTADKLAILHGAVISQCDAQDGLRDGLISDPLACHPDLSKITCAVGQGTDTCLTAEQVHVANEIYRGAHDSAGRGLVISGPLPGSEINWVGVYVPPPGQSGSMSQMTAEGTIRNLDSDPNPPADFKLRDFRFDQANFVATTRLHALYDSTDTDLTAFAKAGGHLILWHGLADPHISPMNTVAYYQGMQRVMGPQAVDALARLYLFPGGAHCGGGEGPFDFDVLTPMIDWVEKGVEPGALIASHSSGSVGPPAGVPRGGPPPGFDPSQGPPPGARPGMSPPTPPAASAKVDRTRPVYPYPQVARYVGHGSIDEATNFAASPGRPWPGNETWYGAGFFTSHEHLWCKEAAARLVCQNARD